MKSNSEIRRESFMYVRQGKWLFRFIVASIVFGLIPSVVDNLMEYMYKTCEIQTWTHYLDARISAAAQGLVYAAPSSSAAWQMHGASLFSVFISLIFTGISYVALAGVFLKAARKKDEKWFSDAFSNFSRPLGCAWLAFVVILRITLWSLLLIVPGIIACYRYSQVWSIKSDHPDWGGARCIAQSIRLMHGFKMQRFLLDLSFLAWVAVALIPVILASAGLSVTSALLPATGGMVRILVIVLLAIGVLAACFVMLWMSAARAVFYNGLCGAAGGTESAEGAAV